ncbi:MAG: HlyD family secretion protein [Celeribacter sp.]|jgi:HlyD family secretion protein
MANDPDIFDLPLIDNGRAQVTSDKVSKKRFPFKLIPLVMVSLFSGAVIGMYFQPPGLKMFFGATGLQPGGGTDTPIAVAIQKVTSQQEIAVLSEGDIVALGRILPNGDVINVAPPYGAGDARVEVLNVSEGSQVHVGDILAVLDSRSQFENVLTIARAELNVNEAKLAQTTRAVRASLAEATAALERAETTATQANADVTRLSVLVGRGSVSATALETAQARASEATRDVERNTATVSRYETLGDLDQPDIAVAKANVQAAQAAVTRAQSDLDRSVVRAPIDGVVLDILTRVGEKPDAAGLMSLGDTSQMMVEAEVYQTLIGRVMIGDPVTVTAEAIEGTLVGHVEAIGLEIGRQSITSDDPAANTDARVVDVIVRLEAASSLRAERLTNLQTVVRIDGGRAAQ